MIFQTAPTYTGLRTHSESERQPRPLAPTPAPAPNIRTFGAAAVTIAYALAPENHYQPDLLQSPTIDIIYVTQGSYTYFENGVWKTSADALVITPSVFTPHIYFTALCSYVLTSIPTHALSLSAQMCGDSVRTYPQLTVAEHEMRAFVTRSITHTTMVTPSDTQAVDRIIIEMGNTVLQRRNSEAPKVATPAIALRERAMTLLAANAHAITLTPQKIAHDCGVSLRHLQSVFATAGTSIAAELRRERAKLAQHMLRDERCDHISIETIAERSGFGSSVSMRRALRETHALTPKELRRGRTELPPQ